MSRIRALLPTTDLGRALFLGLILIWVGLSIALPPLGLLGPGLGLAVPGGILILLTLITPTPPPEADE